MGEQPLFYVGIDPSQRYQPYVYIAIDQELRIQAIGDGPLREVLAYLAGLGSACVAINGPQTVNKGLVDEEEDHQTLFPVPASKRGDLRKIEFQLLQEGINVHRTPASQSECMVWVRRGFKLYQKIQKLGYETYSEQSKRNFVESPSEAIFSRLSGGAPLFDSLSLEGRIQRQLILYEEGMPVKDAMDFFEEVTRFRLIKGVLPDSEIYNPGELNALADAYLAWMLHHQPEKVASMGDDREGIIYIPNKQEELGRFK
jgi:predicted nuclease with RNAse H fold